VIKRSTTPRSGNVCPTSLAMGNCAHRRTAQRITPPMDCRVKRAAALHPVPRPAERARIARAAAYQVEPSCPVPGDPVRTTPMRRDPNAAGRNRRRIDNGRRNGNDRRRNADDDPWPPAAAMPAIMPSGMPTPAAMVPPCRCRRRRQCGHRKRGDREGAHGNPHTRRDLQHGNLSYQTQQRAGRTPPYGPM
jgi:hypothetical protein